MPGKDKFNKEANRGLRDTRNLSADQFSSYVPRLFELVNDLVFSLTPDAKNVLYLNQAAETIYGRPLDELSEQGDLWIDCIHQDDRKLLLEQIAAIAKSEGFGQEFRIVQPDGSLRYLNGSFQSISDDEGQLISVGCVAKDVTNRKDAENRLEESTAIYQSLVESLPINVFRKDREGEIVFVNNKYCETLGRPREKLMGQTDFDLFQQELAEKYLADDRWVLQTGLPFHDIEFHQTEGGDDYTYVEVLKAPVTSADGRRIGIQGMFWDVTDRKKAEIELEKAKDIAVAASQAKSDFLANVSHEIRTPLNAVIGMTDLLLASKTDKTQKNYLQMIQDSGDSLLTLINDILDFSKIESGKLSLGSEWFDLREKLGDTLRSLAFRAHGKNVELICNIDPAIPTMILGDSRRLRQIIVNLVGNSIKFTKKGDIEVDVKCISNEEESVKLKFQIQDTGIGIPEEKLAEIFEEFVQVDTSTTRQYGGTGLGLAIASSLVELMGGKLEVSSKVDVGTEFHFTLEFQTPGNSGNPVGPNEFADVPVMILANNPNQLESVNRLLTSWRMKSFCVSDDEEAIKLAKGMSFADQPIKILLAESTDDVDEQDGFQKLAEQIKRDLEIQTPMFIELVKPTSAKAAVESGTHYHHKLLLPLKYSELLEAVSRCLNGEAEPLTGEKTTAETTVGPFGILLAEDNPVNQKLAVGVLKKNGHQIFVANNGREAVEALQENDFDLVLMDIQMPEMDGIEATHAIRASETGKSKIPIIAMTAHAMAADRLRCLEAGMDEYISKPYRAKELLSLIETLMASRSRESSLRTQLSLNEPSKLIDWNIAFETVGGDRTLLVELIQIFLSEKDTMIDQLESSIESSDSEKIRRSAHSLKGTLHHLGIAKVARIAEKIERLEVTESAKAFEFCKQLKNSLVQLTIELERFTNK